MKLPIKKKYFDEIKEGKKKLELRDAHITFVCEETGEELRKNILGAELVSISSLPDYYISDEEKKELFTDEKLIVFALELPKIKNKRR